MFEPLSLQEIETLDHPDNAPEPAPTRTNAEEVTERLAALEVAVDLLRRQVDDLARRGFHT